MSRGRTTGRTRGGHPGAHGTPSQTSEVCQNVDMDRRTFFTGGVATAMVALTGPASLACNNLPTTTRSRPHPARARTVDPAAIQEIRQRAQWLTDRDMTSGGGVATYHETGRRFFGEALTTLDVDCPARYEGDLLTAVGWIGHRWGFMNHDIGREREARHIWNAALRLADQAGNTSLRARILGSMSRQASATGQHADAIGMIEAALGTAGLTHTERSMLYALRARANAAIGRHSTALESIRLSDSELSSVVAEDVPPWSACFGFGDQRGDTSRALKDLVLIHGHGELANAAADRTAEAVADLPPYTKRRSKALTGINLATINMASGDPEEGVLSGLQALDLSEGVMSRRVVGGLRELRTACVERATGRPDVHALTEQIDMVLAVRVA